MSKTNLRLGACAAAFGAQDLLQLSESGFSAVKSAPGASLVLVDALEKLRQARGGRVQCPAP